jgi:ATP-dependent RNA circularization protein (DNA/RNA ligase family)
MSFLEYPKIDTLFERKEDFSVDPTKLKKSVIGTINLWDVTEKIDGTNVRIMLSGKGEMSYGGRTENAQMPTDLLMKLVNMFPADKLKAAMWKDQPQNPEVILFGEGYGPGIQRGGSYRADKSFILFDVLIEGKWWLDQENIQDVAKKLEIDSVPYLGRKTLDQIIEMVKEPFQSKIGTAMAEGIVARPIETLFDKRGERLIIKLKTKDFKGSKKDKYVATPHPSEFA